MQLSYQMMNLQLLLQGSLDDDYTPIGEAKRHITFGFPISIETPKEHLGEAAEVSVSICNAVHSAVRSPKSDVPPTLKTIIPQEKTYNVASIVNSSTQLGVGAIIANVLNVGASFLHGHQTYYLVRQQDTVALQRSDPVPVATKASTKSLVCPDHQPAVTFAWQFRPVLGQKTIEQGIRQTFAQVSLAPLDNQSLDPPSAAVGISACWRSYDPATGTTGPAHSCSYWQPRLIPILYNSLLIHEIAPTINGDGSVTALVRGTFPPGTRVGLGDLYLSEAIPGFENTGQYIRFTAPPQLVGLSRFRLIAPDGNEAPMEAPEEVQQPLTIDKENRIVIEGFKPRTEVFFDGTKVYTSVDGTISFSVPDNTFAAARIMIRRSDASHSSCWLPSAPKPDGASFDAVATPFSDTVVMISVPLWKCMEVQSQKQYPPIVVLAGRTFGLADAPFRGYDPARLTFLAPASLVQGQTSLLLRRLFLGQIYDVTYSLRSASEDASVTGIFALGSTTTGAAFALTGSKLQTANIVFPQDLGKLGNLSGSSNTLRMFDIPTRELASVKTVVVRAGGASFIETLPPVSTSAEESSKSLKIAILESTKTTITYLLTGEKGSNLNQAKFLVPRDLPKGISADTYLEFSLSKEQATDLKSVLIQLSAARTPGPLTVLIPLPAIKDTAPSGASLTPDPNGVAKGSTAPYKISGTKLQSVTEVRYLNTPIPFSYSGDGTSMTIPQLPPSLVANPGGVPLEIRFADGSKQSFTVIVNP